MDDWLDGQESAEMATNQTSSECGMKVVHDPKVAPALYLSMFPIALLLNGAAAWVSLHLRSTTTFVVYLKSLVAGDLLLTLMIPIKAMADLPGRSNQLFVLSCRYFFVIFYSTMYTCIGLMGLISLDCFFKIMRPRSKLFGQSLTFSKLMSASVWLIIFGASASPNIILSHESTNVTAIRSCMELKGQVGLQFHHAIVISLNVFFWLVSLLMVVCYGCIANKVIQSFRKSGSSNSQGKQKIKLRVFLLVVVFFVSFGPFHLVRVPYVFHQVKVSTQPMCTDSGGLGKFAKELSLWLAITNTCLNPLLYVFLCKEFKEKLVSLRRKMCPSR